MVWTTTKRVHGIKLFIKPCLTAKEGCLQQFVYGKEDAPEDTKRKPSTQRRRF